MFLLILCFILKPIKASFNLLLMTVPFWEQWNFDWSLKHYLTLPKILMSLIICWIRMTSFSIQVDRCPAWTILTYLIWRNCLIYLFSCFFVFYFLQGTQPFYYWRYLKVPNYLSVLLPAEENLFFNNISLNIGIHYFPIDSRFLSAPRNFPRRLVIVWAWTVVVFF